MRLDDRRILVTGASSGIGAHLAKVLVARGARVAAAARRRDALEELAAGSGRSIIPVAMDVANPASVREGVAAAAEALGGLDGLVNNAGTAWGGHAIDMTDEDWDLVVEVNLSGVFRVAREAAKLMAAGGGGAIVNTASILGFGTGRGVAAYATTKAAVVHLTRSLALELARVNIRVNAIAPGYFPTEMNEDFLQGAEGQKLQKAIPLRRFGRLEDLDAPVVLLLSDAGAYITGVTLPIDGGHLVRPL